MPGVAADIVTESTPERSFEGYAAQLTGVHGMKTVRVKKVVAG